MRVDKFSDEKYTFQVSLETRFLRLRSLPFCHALVKLCYHARLENLDFYAANRLWLFFSHKVCNGVPHGIRRCRGIDSAFT